MKLSRIASGLRIKPYKHENCSPFKKYMIFDLDDVLADPNPKRIAILDKPGEPDWEAFYQTDFTLDKPLALGIMFFLACSKNYRIIILTSRRERVRDATTEWLGKHRIPFDRLVMRDNPDDRPACDMKTSYILSMFTPGEIAGIVDDDESTIRELARRGYPTILWNANKL